MNKKVIWLSLIIILLAGCESFWYSMADPNSTQNMAVDKTGQVVTVVKESAPLFGSAAIPLTVITNTILAVIGVYKNKRKNLTIAGKDVLIAGQSVAFNNVTETTKAIVEAIDAVEDATGIKVKDEVKKKLLEHQIYKTGKSIISGLKTV